MRPFYPLLLALIPALYPSLLFSQAVFTSAASGNWNDPASWTYVSGTITNNYPGAGDSAVIAGGHSIVVNVSSQVKSLTIRGASALLFNVSNSSSVLAVSNECTLTEGSFLNMIAGVLTITGNITINAASSITQNGGAINIIGLGFLIAPTASSTPSAGTSLIHVAGGIFSCAGGFTLTSLANTSRLAELRIGDGAVNMVGALTTTTVNAKINFSGMGMLTLAGPFTVPFADSFTAGSGRVNFFGIPGSNQAVTPLNYSKLIISGTGGGIKEINGAVTVADSLTLLSDTLQINSGGSLTLNNNATVVRTGGKLTSPPVFVGNINLVYNNVTKDTTGAEMPVATIALQNITINNIGGVVLGSHATINNKLFLQNGALSAGAYTLLVNNPAGGISSDPAIERTNGYIIGKLQRAIGTGTGIRLFPFGINNTNGYREFRINYTTAPAVAGILSVEHFATVSDNQTGLPLTEGSNTLALTLPLYWQADVTGGLSGGTYTLSLTAAGVNTVIDYTALSIVKRPTAGGAWTLDGIAAANEGSNTAPVVIRNSMNGFSQFAIAGPATALPIKLNSFTGSYAGSKIVLNWTTGNEQNNQYFVIEHSTTGYTFSEAGRITGAGSTANTQSYSWTDNYPSGGNNYYRLKQVDTDGQYSYSKLINVPVKVTTTLKAYPTIVHNTLNVNAPGTAVIYLCNQWGQHIQTLHNGQNQLSHLAAGIYFISDAQSTIRIIRL